jgi:hypothetical protein
MFGVNRAARTFLEEESTTIRNGFVNDGLIDYQVIPCFYGFEKLERLYF